MWYFAYGTNMDRERLELHRAIRVKEVRRGELDNHRIVFDKVSAIRPATGCANIVPEAGSRVLGVLYRIRDEDMEKMDIFEGVSSGRCHRERVLVRAEDNALIEAEVYVADETKAGLEPSFEYLEWVLKGAEESGLDEEYVERTFRAPMRRAAEETRSR
jgi:gamma-glutamylcyclotransferase (GGCT)/AIG2-like uncharacterized protein YtfP